MEMAVSLLIVCTGLIGVSVGTRFGDPILTFIGAAVAGAGGVLFFV